MDGQKYAVAEYENQQNHAKKLETVKPTSGKYLHQKGGGRFAAAPLLVQVFERCRFLGFQVFCMILLIFCRPWLACNSTDAGFSKKSTLYCTLYETALVVSVYPCQPGQSSAINKWVTQHESRQSISQSRPSRATARARGHRGRGAAT